MIFAASFFPLLLLLQPTAGNRRAELLGAFAAKAQAASDDIDPIDASARNAPTRHSRVMLDASIRSKIQRQLAELPVTEFCSNLASIEMYTTDRFMSLIPGTPFLTEDEEYVCSCLIQGEILDLVCGTFYSDGAVPIANLDYMQLQLGVDETYTATGVGWCEYLDGSYEGAAYCEDYIMDSDDSSKLASCFIRDDTCRVADAPACEICEGGQSIAIVSNENCYNTSILCEDNYMGAFLYEYHVASPIKATTDAPVDCVDDAPTVDEFCAELSEIGVTITEAFRNLQPDLDLTPYECNCVGDNSTVAVSCENFYLFDSFSNATFRNTEVMAFSEQNGYLVPSQMQWCDFNLTDSSIFYCESFDFGLLQNELSFCEFGDCGAGFCELCSDGLSVGQTCTANQTCSDSIPGAFLFAYKDTKLAVEKCSTPSPPTDAPVASATPAPVDTPTLAPDDGSTPAPMDSVTPAPSYSPTVTPAEVPTPAPVEPEEQPTQPPTESKASLTGSASVVCAALAVVLVVTSL